ncbi:MAG: KUP/HAK/KT family potassium transporter [Opitutaceae bacterium]|jgi:KUP system potassium uptake protein|nr:KUP/HAK/KT family potassium transporter [Opitutaceae bacterium]
MTSPPAGQDSNAAVRTALLVGALGVVFGDIGTSPLYAFRESIDHLAPADRVGGVLGVLSLIFWSLMVVVSLKYTTVVMRADNHGEGGIFALLSLSGLDRPQEGRKRLVPGVLIVLLGASMLCGEGVITPAISVLSAAEGIKLIIPAAEPYILPLSLAILVTLYGVQRKGTHRIGQWFGPIMAIWFLVLGGLGIYHMVGTPEVLRSLNPMHGWHLLQNHPLHASAILGSVVLAITGVEALYADMGHFGRPAIMRAWYFLVLPGLTLNYFGQGAYVLSHPYDNGNPFLSLAPAGAPRTALLILSLFAAVIASQALISGTYSLVRQAIQLGFFPRLKVLHTNALHQGQIYVPLVNSLMAIGSIVTVLLFKSSSALAGAYGIAVTGAMTATTFTLFFAARRRWGWSLPAALGACAGFAIIDLGFLAANVPKIAHGGWLPLAIGAVIFAIMHTWKSGRSEIQERIYGSAVTELELSSIARSKNIVRVPGGAVFMVGTPKGTPLALLHHLKANKCLQQTVVLLTITTQDTPQVDEDDRMSLDFMGEGVWRAIGRYGYMESPDVSKLVERIKSQGVPINPMGTTYYFNREMIISGGNARMFEWQKNLYAFLSRNATPVKDYYQILPTQIIEIGLPVQL